MLATDATEWFRFELPTFARVAIGMATGPGPGQRWSRPGTGPARQQKQEVGMSKDMSRGEATQVIEKLNELAHFYDDFDRSDYTDDEMRELARESIAIAERARAALRTKHCKRRLTREVIVDLEAMCVNALKEADQTLADLG
jgi:hypothetical protein